MITLYRAVIPGMVLATIFGLAIYLGADQRGTARIAPLSVAFLGLTLAVLQVAREGSRVWARRREAARARVRPESGAVAGQPSSERNRSSSDAHPLPSVEESVPISILGRLRTSGPLWILALLGLYIAFGTIAALVIYTPLYMRIRARTAWWKIGVTLAIAYGIIEYGFIDLLGLRTYPGMFF